MTPVLVAVFLVLAIVESCWPAHEAGADARRRWATNLALLLSAGLVQRLAAPMFVMVVFPRFVAAPVLPAWGQFVLALLWIDGAQYALHRGMHAHSWLWRIHRVHHSDQDMDVSTAFRHHPFEALATVIILAPAGAFVRPEWFAWAAALSWATDLFRHSNVALPVRLDRALRCLFCTPGMHAVHHGPNEVDSARNYGATLIWWDRLFGSYVDSRGEPDGGYGLPGARGSPADGPLALLAMPFRP